MAKNKRYNLDEVPTRNADGSYNISYNGDNYTIQPSALNSGNITVTTPEVVVKGKRPYSPYSFGTYVPFEYSRNSYYRPEDALEAFITRGEKRSLENRGKSTTYITTGGAGYIPDSETVLRGVQKSALDYAFGNNSKQIIRKRLYDNISPYSYANALNRVHNAVVKNKREYNDYKDSQRDDIFAEYLGIPKSERHRTGSTYWKLTTSKYKPSIGGSNTKYFAINLPKEVIDDLYNDVYFGTNVRNSNGLGINENAVSETIDPLGRHTIGRGYDSKGEYMSYYDVWDLTPYGHKLNDQSFDIGNPVNIYDRIYLDDYYGVPYPYRGSTYLPEVIVEGKRKKKSLGGVSSGTTLSRLRSHIPTAKVQPLSKFTRRFNTPAEQYMNDYKMYLINQLL